MVQGPFTPADTPPPEESDVEGAQLDRYRARIRVFAARRLHDWTAAEDVAQETLQRVLEALRAGRVQHLEALPGYIFQTAFRVCLHRMRSADRESRALQRAGSATEGATSEEGPLAALISAEQRAGLLAAVERLEPDDRQVLQLTFRDELDSAEVGRRMNLSAGAVCVRRHRAIRKLAAILGVRKGPERDLED
jgi:RNA polymerase sigma-70 factor (ECF subfamily)